MQAHCPKCRVSREIANPQVVTAANGKPLTRGNCAVCGSVLMRVMEGVNRESSMANRESPMADPESQMAERSARNADAKSQAADGKARVANREQPDTRGSRVQTASPEKAGVRDAKPKRKTAGRAKTPASTRGTRARRPPAVEDDIDADDSAADASSSVDRAPSSLNALVIVESPAKAKTIGKFLGRNYKVRASVGHIRDLPIKDMGVDIEHDFKPRYEITAKKRDVVKELREYAEGAREIYLATDPDREGEAISWHLAAVLKSQIAGKPVHRVEFHEITKNAIASAFSHPRQLDMGRVDAQQARRVLDRIVGYTISPLLSRKIKKRSMSAGRVQSVAVRLVVEREREIENFVAVEYWSIEAELKKKGNKGAGNFETGREVVGTGADSSQTPGGSSETANSVFRARLIKVGDKDFECHTGEEALRLKAVLEKCDYRVTDVRRKDVTRNPYAPYITSTLQQDASRRLGFNPKRTMKVAQELYEGIDIGEEGTVGLITYMRTDSTNVAEAAQKEALEYIEQKFGESYLPPKPRVYAKKVAGAQEAHEAIRPTKTFREPRAVREYLDNDQFRLYDLIWKRFVASQMASAIFDTTAVDVEALVSNRYSVISNQMQSDTIASASSNQPAGNDKQSPVTHNQSAGVNLESLAYLFRANGSILKFAGYLAVYGRSVGDADEEDDTDKRLPPLVKNEPLDLLGIYPEQHFTEPPPRFTEATLIKALEQHGIGRPSTYAPIMANIQDRDYIEQIEGRRLKPTELGFVVNDLLVAHFANIVDLGFTAQMEEKLDAVEEGKQDWVALMREFYNPFKETLDRATQEMPITQVAAETSDQVCDLCGAPMVVKKGKFGKFLSCSRFPACKGMKRLTTGVRCPKCKQGEIRELKSKKGRVFYGCSRYPQCDFVSWDKPLAEPCPKCGGMLVQGARNMIRCVNGDYTRAANAAAEPSPNTT